MMNNRTSMNESVDIDIYNNEYKFTSNMKTLPNYSLMLKFEITDTFKAYIKMTTLIVCSRYVNVMHLLIYVTFKSNKYKIVYI